MEISLTNLQNYSQKKGFPFNISINVEYPNDPQLTIIKGTYEQRGGTRIYIDYKDLKDLLLHNNILGPNGKLKAELDAFNKDLKDGIGDRNNREAKIEELIYGTITEYLHQMLNASIGTIFNPEIKPLDKHKNIYFRESVMP
jgi:hypothetical protein